MHSTIGTALRAAAVTVVALGLAGGAQAQWRGHGGGYHGGSYYHGGGYYRGGGWYGAPWVWGGVGLGLGLGLASAYAAPSYYAAPTYVVEPPAVVYAQPAVTLAPSPVPAAVSATAAPVIYPRNGQSAAQRERDSDQCSEWAGQQPNATGDRSVFNRGIAACMDARGYTLR